MPNRSPKSIPPALGAAISRACRGSVPRDHSRTTKEIKAMQAQATIQNRLANTITHGDCIQVMRQMPANSVGFIPNDPPYLVNYRDRDGRSIRSDVNSDSLKPAIKEACRVLKQDRLAVVFYGWRAVDWFFAIWHGAGFYPVGHILLDPRGDSLLDVRYFMVFAGLKKTMNRPGLTRSAWCTSTSNLQHDQLYSSSCVGKSFLTAPKRSVE